MSIPISPKNNQTLVEYKILNLGVKKLIRVFFWDGQHVDGEAQGASVGGQAGAVGWLEGACRVHAACIQGGRGGPGDQAPADPRERSGPRQQYLR